MTAAQHELVLYSRDEHVVTITLNRPEKRNAFNAELVKELIPAVRMIDSSPGRFPNRLEYDSLCVSRRFAGSATGWAGRSRSPVLSFRRRS
jgi:hypothetical protein